MTWAYVLAYDILAVFEDLDHLFITDEKPVRQSILDHSRGVDMSLPERLRIQLGGIYRYTKAVYNPLGMAYLQPLL